MAANLIVLFSVDGQGFVSSVIGICILMIVINFRRCRCGRRWASASDPVADRARARDLQPHDGAAAAGVRAVAVLEISSIERIRHAGNRQVEPRSRVFSAHGKPDARIYCLPYAGGSASICRLAAGAAGEPRGVRDRVAGGGRFSEPALTHMDAVVDELVRVVGDRATFLSRCSAHGGRHRGRAGTSARRLGTSSDRTRRVRMCRAAPAAAPRARAAHPSARCVDRRVDTPQRVAGRRARAQRLHRHLHADHPCRSAVPGNMAQYAARGHTGPRARREGRRTGVGSGCAGVAGIHVDAIFDHALRRWAFSFNRQCRPYWITWPRSSCGRCGLVTAARLRPHASRAPSITTEA